MKFFRWLKIKLEDEHQKVRYQLHLMLPRVVSGQFGRECKSFLFFNFSIKSFPISPTFRNLYQSKRNWSTYRKSHQKWPKTVSTCNSDSRVLQSITLQYDTPADTNKNDCACFTHILSYFHTLTETHIVHCLTKYCADNKQTTTTRLHRAYS